ncbi:hypothetical protein EJ08DRAFT_157131 [Tothia fuscella]|uniref:Glucose receptor Git3 N-terminal domain-containing protein n=1 Tax=Tothia fuscella TaxID=1048955 RepID=A0A9P4P538_9PEZI|nr:hypothetical protein EJ08DRAFT_157131 [Tothia fuscella]
MMSLVAREIPIIGEHEELKRSMFGLLLISFTSIVATGGVLTWICYHSFFGAKKTTLSRTNESFLKIIIQILVADFIQSQGYFMSIHWLIENKIHCTTPLCSVQGFTINFGDTASALFVLYMSIQTLIHLKRLRVPSLTIENTVIASLWVLAAVLSFLGPAIFHRPATANHRPVHYFMPAGAWCWVSKDFKPYRLAFQTAWIFLAETGTMVIYGLVFHELCKLNRKLKALTRGFDMSHQMKAPSAIQTFSRRVIAYPAVYTLLTFPLAFCRILQFYPQLATMPDYIICAVGCIATSCGWVDAIIYAYGRKGLLLALGGTGDEVSPRHRYHTWDSCRAISLEESGSSSLTALPEYRSF